MFRDDEAITVLGVSALLRRSGGRAAILVFSALGVTACAAAVPSDETSINAEAEVPPDGPETAFEVKAWSCTGLTGKTQSPAGAYDLTSFGCWHDAKGNHGDPGDNCLPACTGAPGYSEVCGNKSGPDCERATNYYVADADRFGCFARLRITNPKNGKSVVAVVLDRGPNCTVEKKVKTWVLDASTPVALHLFGEPMGVVDEAKVVVVPVDASTPLGPVGDDGMNGASSSGSSSSASGGGADPVDAPLTIDDDDGTNGASTHFAISEGWTKSTNVAGYYGKGYHWRSVGSTTDLARFEFQFAAAHAVKVEARWTAGSDRSKVAPFVILDANDQVLGKVLVDQRSQGGQWVALGTFAFPKGWNAVALSRWTSPGGVVVADAVRVTPLD